MGHPISLAVAPGEEEDGGGGGGGGGNESSSPSPTQGGGGGGDRERGASIYMGFQDTSVRRVQAAAVCLPLIEDEPASSAIFHPERLGLGDFEAHHCGPVTALTIYKSYIVSGKLAFPTRRLFFTTHPPPPTHPPTYLPPGAGDGLVKVWNPITKSCIRTLQGHHGSVLLPSLPTHPPSLLFSTKHTGAGDGFVKVWNPSTKSCIRTLQGHHGSVLTLVAGVEAGVVISGSRDGTVKVWDMVRVSHPPIDPSTSIQLPPSPPPSK